MLNRELIALLQTFDPGEEVALNHDLGCCPFAPRYVRKGYYRPKSPAANAIDQEDFEWQDDEEKEQYKPAIIIG